MLEEHLRRCHSHRRETTDIDEESVNIDEKNIAVAKISSAFKLYLTITLSLKLINTFQRYDHRLKYLSTAG